MATADKDLTDPRVQGPPVRLLTVREVAERLAVSTKTVYRLKSEGVLAYVKVRGSLRFGEDDLRSLENRCRVTPAGYGGVEDVILSRLNLQFEVTKRGRGPRRR